MTTYFMGNGLNYVNDPRNRLQGCVNDMLDMHDLMLQIGVKQSNITLLSDDPNRQDISPTRKNILAHLKRNISLLKAGDTFVFQYSGHGTHTHDRSNDEADGRDEAICPIDGQNISDDEIYAIFRKIPKGVKSFVLMDCCHSGSNVDLANGLDKQESKRKDDLTHGLIVQLAGCQDHEVSLDVLSKSKPKTEQKNQDNREIKQEVKKRGALPELRYRGALTAAFMQVIEKRHGFLAVLETLFSGSKSMMRALNNEILTILKSNDYPQVPRISYEGQMPVKPSLQVPEPLLFNYGYRVGRYNLRQTEARNERDYTESKELKVYTAKLK